MSTQDPRIDVVRRPGRMTVNVYGAADARLRPSLEQAYRRAHEEEQPALVLDLRRATSLDDALVGWLAGLDADRPAVSVLVGDDDVRRTLVASSLDLRLEPPPSPDAAAERVVKAFYAAINARDWAAMHDLLDPEVEWSVPTLILGSPVLRGRDEVLGFLRAAAIAVPSMQTSARTFDPQPGGSLTVTGHHRPGADAEVWFRHHWTVRGDVVTALAETIDGTAYAELLER